jgi:steroid delta-isomerase-like uncharacterized protein
VNLHNCKGDKRLTTTGNEAAIERNKETFRSIIEEGFNKGNYAALDPLFAADYQEHQFGLKMTLEGFKGDIQYLRTAFPDFHLTIDDMIAENDMVWARMTARGTNHGPFLGAPTGKPFSAAVMDVCRFKDGKLVEHWGVPDRFATIVQLGLLPQAAGSKWEQTS